MRELTERQTSRTLHPMLALVVSTLLMGCGMLGLGGVAGGNEPVRDEITAVRGTVERVDTRERIITVDEAEASYGTRLRNADERLSLHYDDRTVVEFEGRTYRPEDLEPGDRIAADVDRRGNRLVAHQVDVLYDVSGGRDDRYGDRYEDRDTQLRGEVRHVDTRDRTLEIERSRYDRGFSRGESSSEAIVILDYDRDTVVEYEGRRYRPENLERGDFVEIDAREIGRRLVAERIVVVENVRDRGSRYDR